MVETQRLRHLRCQRYRLSSRIQCVYPTFLINGKNFCGYLDTFYSSLSSSSFFSSSSSNLLSPSMVRDHLTFYNRILFGTMFYILFYFTLARILGTPMIDDVIICFVVNPTRHLLLHHDRESRPLWVLYVGM